MADDRPLSLIAFTPPEPVADEGAKIAALIDEGWAWVHLRHPNEQSLNMIWLISTIPAEARRRVKLHEWFDLAKVFNLGGVHLNSRWPTPPADFVGSISKSCHTVAEVSECQGFDYVTLSPVFDSISKPGYMASEFDLSQLPEPRPKIIALGGVTPERLGDVKALGFDGAAMLGAIPWQGSVDDVRQFAKQASIKSNISVC